MNNYSFKAIDETGKILKGTAFASSESEIVNILKERNQMPVSIEVSGKKSVLEKDIEIIPKKVKTIDLAIMCRQIATMLTAGISIDRALEIQINQTKNKTLKEELTEVSEEVSAGTPFSTALENKTDYPEILIHTIRAGENIGDLDGSLERMATHFEKEHKVNSKIKSAMTYPTAIFFITIAISLGLITFVLPQFADMFSQLGSQLPALTRALMAFSDFLRGYWYINIGIVVGIGYLLYKWANTDSGIHTIANFKLKTPIVKGYMQQIITARFTRTLSTMIDSGISIIDALKMAGQTTNNVVVEDRVNGIIDDVKKGMPLSGQLRSIDVFPEMMLSLLSIGEETGQMGSMLRQAADFYDEEFDRAVEKLLGLIEPVMIVFLAGMVGTIVLAMYLPMFNIYELI